MPADSAAAAEPAPSLPRALVAAWWVAVVAAVALRLWNATTAWLEFPFLFELQRPKNEYYGKIIADRFQRYLEARDWVSINRGKVVTFDT